MPTVVSSPRVAKPFPGFRILCWLRGGETKRKCVAVLTSTALLLSANAGPKDAVGLSKISLPSGPGSIEGLGDSFEPQLNSGTSAYSVKISSPPGINGLQPNLVLHYNAGAGNGHFGLGWSDGLMCIQRQTEKGLPTYGAQDVFTFQGEELVPLADGSYRMENESGFMRIRRSGEGWEITDKSGTRYFLGSTTASRIRRPGGATFTDTFKWLVEAVVDTRSNRVEYVYTTFPDSPGEIYCAEIRYSISRSNPAIYHAVRFDYETRPDAFASFLSGFEVRCGRRCREIRVESQGSLVRRYTLNYTPDIGDPVEQIAPSDAGLAFSLIRKVTQFDNGANTNSYLPPLRFGYTRFAAADGRFGIASNLPPYTISNPNIAFLDVNGDSLPDLLYTDPTTFAHQVFYNRGNGAFDNAVSYVAVPSTTTLDTPSTELADYDGDGHVDLVQKSGGSFDRFVFYPNTTAPRDVDESRPAWGSEHSFAGPYPPFDLGDPSVRTLDLNGDKKIDFFRTTPWGFIYYYNRGTWWEEDGLHLFGESVMGDLTAGDDVGFSKPGAGGAEVSNEQVKLADMNGDRLLDLVRVSRFGNTLEITFWPNKGRGAWGNRQSMSGTINIGPTPTEDVFIQDINGDGLADVVQVDFNTITFWVNQGNYSYSAPFTVTGTPEYIRGQTMLRQADINGNGSTDFLWENWSPALGGYKLEYFDFLPVKPNLLRVIDNGIGLRTVIEYKTTTDAYLEARAAGNPWHTRLPFPSTVVSKITKQIGLNLDGAPGNDEYTTEFGYFDGFYDGFEKEFRGFAFAKKIERGDDRYPGITNHSPTTVTRFAFHTGVHDGIDNNEDGTVDEKNELSGYEEEPLKGKVLWTETTLPTADIGGSYPAQLDGQPASDAVVFTREYNDWRIKLIHSPTTGFTYRDAFGVDQPSLSLPYQTTDGKRVSFAFVARHTTESIEANGALAGTQPFTPVRPRKTLYSETDVDFFGNTIAERNYGENSAGSTYDDERFSESTYAFNLDDWLIGLPARKLTTDENGVFVSESRSYYDGADFTGLALGQVGTRGEVMRAEQLVNGSSLPPAFSVISKGVGDPRLAANYAIINARNRYDTYGNLIETRDPLFNGAGQGHAKEYAYDSTFNTYVTTETIHVGNGSPDLVASATYDFGAGVMLSALNFNNQPSSFLYDSFWRLVGIVKPGDSTAFPTASFSYKPADSFRSLYFNYSALGQLTLESTGDPFIASAVSTRQREVAGTTNTFDTISFTDGAGHKLGTLHENDVAGQWVAKDFKLFSSQGEERKALLPFLVSSPAYSIPPDSSVSVASFYDSASRVVRTVNPPETTNALATLTETRTIYLPLETILYDEEDVNPASAYFNTPHVQLKDGLDRLIGVIERTKLNDDGTVAASQVDWPTSYEYDLNDNLTHITDSQGNQKWFRYDGLKRKLFMNDPDRGTMTYTYDDASNLRSTLDAKAQTINYAYDGVNRLLTEHYRPTNQPPDVTYHYDAPYPIVPVGDGTFATGSNTKGMLAWVQDLSGEEHTSYDARGRVDSVIKRIPDPQFLSTTNLSPPLVSFRTGFAYDSLDRVTTLTYADNDQVSYLYNARNLLARITGGPSGSIISNILYRASDQLQQIDYGNGVRTTYDYDPRLRLNSLQTISQLLSTNSELIHFAYDFDGVSNIKKISDNRPVSAVPAGDARRNTQIFQYDDLYRITRAQYSFAAPGATADNGSINYRYDRIGNMMAQHSDIAHFEKGVSVTELRNMSYGGAAGKSGRIGRAANDPPGPHALTSVSQLSTNKPQPRIYPYDPNGNMTVIDGLTNTWDFKDRLIAVENAEMRAQYTYDYTDRRILKRVWPKPTNSVLTSSSYLPTSTSYPDKYFEVREHDAPTKYVWNGNTRVARVTGSLNTNQRVQRLRLWPGWNLVSLAVSSPSPLWGEGWGEVLSAAFRWDQPTLTWLPVATNETLSARTVLWLHASTNTTATVTGTYAPPVNATAPTGPSFQPGAGLQAWNLMASNSNLLTSSFWKYDGPSQTWLVRYGTNLPGQSDFPETLAAGEGFMARADASTTLEVPESMLRIRYYHQDHIGSASALSDQIGKPIENASYYPFGHARSQQTPYSRVETYRFSQKEQDEETGLLNFEARFYDSLLCRFTQPDPLCHDFPKTWLFNPQRQNSVAYCLNSPIKWIDPTGLDVGNPDSTRNGGSGAYGTTPLQDSARNALKEFEADNPEAAGKARVTSLSRTPEKQTDIIVSREKSYPGINSRFKKEFSVNALPKYKDLTPSQLKWFVGEVMKQAGKSPGFAHVGGKALDISVRDLSTAQKQSLLDRITSGGGMGVLFEKVHGDNAKYKGVSLEDANVFHIYQKEPPKSPTSQSKLP